MCGVFCVLVQLDVDRSGLACNFCLSKAIGVVTFNIRTDFFSQLKTQPIYYGYYQHYAAIEMGLFVFSYTEIMKHIEIRENGLGKFQVWNTKTGEVLHPSDRAWSPSYQSNHTHMFFNSRSEAIRHAKMAISKNQLKEVLSLEESIKTEANYDAPKNRGLLSRFLGGCNK
jgi:hypothetical protein